MQAAAEADRHGRRHRDRRASTAPTTSPPDPGPSRGRRRSSAAAVPQGTLGGWDVRAFFNQPDAGAGPRAGRCWIWRTASPRSGWLSARAASRCPRCGAVLTDVLLDLAPVVLDAGAEAIPAARALLEVAAARGSRGRQPVGQSRTRSDRLRRPHRPPSPTSRPAAAFVAEHVKAHPAASPAAHHRRRRAGLPRRGRLRGAGARGLARCGRGLPAGARRCRPVAEAGLRAARISLRRDGRPVPHDRQAAGGPQALGPGRRRLWGARQPSRASCSTR